jgi:hypothetical protein
MGINHRNRPTAKAIEYEGASRIVSPRGSTGNNTASRGRGNSEVEQQLENEPTRDATKMEQSRTTRME